jgi:hypothetical protein
VVAKESAAPRGVPVTTATTTAESESRQQQLEAMRLVLARLLGRFTEEHPEVISLRSQIDRLEQQIEAGDRAGSPPASGPQLIPGPPGDRQATPGRSIRPAAANRPLATRAEDLQSGGHRTAGEAAAAVAAGFARLARISRERQSAEQRLSDRMQEISNQPTAAEWSAEPAYVVTRLGGTPRCATVVFGGILAAIGGALMFRGSAVVVQPVKIESASELASVLEIPVIGNLTAMRKAAARLQWRLFTAGRVRVLVHGAEAIVGLAMLACLLAIVVEPSLARQVAADPFGTLSEVIGRLGI